jgi:hypothetical protein
MAPVCRMDIWRLPRTAGLVKPSRFRPDGRSRGAKPRLIID